MFMRDYSKFSNESFRDDVSIQDWNYTQENVHNLFKDFYSKLEGSVNRNAPLKKLFPKEIKIKNKPWLNVEILKMIKIRNKVFYGGKKAMSTVNVYMGQSHQDCTVPSVTFFFNNVDL